MEDNMVCRCCHYPENLLKLNENEEWVCRVFKNVLPSPKPITPKICAMCHGIGYRFEWTDKYNAESGNRAQSPVNQNLLDTQAFSMGREQAGYLYTKMCEELSVSRRYNYVPKAYFDFIWITEMKSWAFPISQESSGEVFHLAVVKILYPTKITIFVEPIKTEYKGLRIETKHGQFTQTGKKAYDLLHFYGLFRNPDQKSNEEQALHFATEIIADTFNQNTTQQDKLFTMIRSTFERSHVPTDAKESRCSLSSLGSYYLNCFLRLTGQNGGQLPRLVKNESAALIFVRDTDKDERKMNLSNIKQCLSAIMQANATTLEHGQAMRQFKHVILFGDFLKVDDKPRTECIKLCKDRGISCTIISQPWASKEDLNPTDESRRFWAEYREEGKVFKPGWEGVPFQVKNLSLFLALRSQYGDNICWIGFRSGFLDGAAFLGIPIFYIDQPLPLKEGNPEQWLWKTSNVSDRMVDASNKINTFIRLDIPAAQKWALSKNDRVRLGAALYTYMLHGQEEPLWTKKVAMFANEEAKPHIEAAIRVAQAV